jgi:hypothetical protein
MPAIKHARMATMVTSPIRPLGHEAGNGLLADTLTIAPIGVYGFRKLRSAYSGSLIRLRRVSDSVEQDIGFTVNGDLDTASANTFIGGSSATVKTWYDQSGSGNDLTQATILDQPTYVASQSSLGNKPTMKFNRISNTDGNFLTAVNSGTLTFTGNMTCVMCINPEALNVGRQDWIQKGGGGSTAGEFGWLMENNTALPHVDRPFVKAGANAPAGLTAAAHVISWKISSGTTTHYKNGATNGTDAALGAGTTSSQGLRIGTGNYASAEEDPARGWFAELVIWNTLADADRRITEVSMGNYYGVTIT